MPFTRKHHRLEVAGYLVDQCAMCRDLTVYQVEEATTQSIALGLPIARHSRLQLVCLACGLHFYPMRQAYPNIRREMATEIWDAIRCRDERVAASGRVLL